MKRKSIFCFVVIAIFFFANSAKANIQIDQSNLPTWSGGWTAMSWDQSQTFQPGLPILTGVDIDIFTANPHLGDDIITVEIIKSGVVLATASQFVSYDFPEGLLHFDFPTKVSVNVGETYVLSVPGTKDTFGWKFGGDTYPNGVRYLGGNEKYGTDWFFQTYGLPDTPDVMLATLAQFIMDEVDLGNITPELEGSLLVKIDTALAALDKGNPNDSMVAMNDLKALINQVEAQTDKKITPEAAAGIIQQVNAIIEDLEG
jgi:hypothetical protein